MSSYEENYYEILDIPSDASPFEIRRAFQEMFELYQGESLVSYSFFTETERKNLIARLEGAYFTLINEERRNVYDGMLINQGWMTEENRHRNTTKVPIPLYNPMHRFTGPSQPSSSKNGTPVSTAPNAIVQELLEKEALTGQDLRDIRMALQISLERIAQESKIKIGILQAIEQDLYKQLPPMPYLKGFVKLYARCLQIDENKVVSAYLRHPKMLLP